MIFIQCFRYWERGDGRLLENGEKYRIESTIDSKSNYKTKMKLTITRINRYDYTDYYCIAKNEKTYEPVRGQLTVYGKYDTSYHTIYIHINM